jgi:hypothetical protein
MELKMIKKNEFHFVCNNSLKIKILKIGKLLNLSLSKTIIYIAENMNILSTKLHFFYSDENNQVENVNWDKHIHVYFKNDTKYIYNKLKSIHKDNNTYSIACKLRYLLNVFLRGEELYGLNMLLEIIEKAAENLKELLKNQKIWFKKKKIRQLSETRHIYVEYDKNYSAILIKLLN